MEASSNGNVHVNGSGAGANSNGAHVNGNGAHANGTLISENSQLSAKRRLGLAFGPTYEEAALGLPNYWYPVMFSVQIGKRPKAVKLLGKDLVLTRVKRKVYALEDRCPHRGIPLHNGKFEFEGCLTCIYHGWTFDLGTGQMVAALVDGPDSPMACRETTAIRSYPVEERCGLVWVWMGAGEPMVPVEDDIPEEMLRDDMHMMGWIHARYGNWRFGVENAIDEGHARYLHVDSVQSRWRRAPAVTVMKVVETPDKKWIYRKVEGSETYADFPGLGTWPRKRWWRKDRNARQQKTRQKVALSVIPEAARPGSDRLPCIHRPIGWPYPMVVSYEWHVPVDAENELYCQFMCRFTKNPISLAIFKMKYLLWHRWVGQWRFNSQDGSMVAAMTANMKSERLMRPDASITGWRKMVERQARGQVDEWRSIGVEAFADPELEIQGAGKAAADLTAAYSAIES
jgi:phenylpropionate dioxygenase-like ring-hydroxylating dioxygenase large terminal subunit